MVNHIVRAGQRRAGTHGAYAVALIITGAVTAVNRLLRVKAKVTADEPDQVTT